jgi:hypothetical protein
MKTGRPTKRAERHGVVRGGSKAFAVMPKNMTIEKGVK